MKHDVVHTAEGRKPSPPSFFTPQSNLGILKNLFGRMRPMLNQSMASEIDAGLECLEDIRKWVEDRS